MKWAIILTLCVIAAKAQDANDIGLNVYQLIERYNFTYEEHEFQTEDGYILQVQRIPYGRTAASGKGSVLLMHGLTCSSADWVCMGEKSLAFMLADAGFDVWLANSRGNRHGRRHVTLDPDVDVSQFWNFSWDEIGRYDLPATIDYILSVTKDTGVYYAGHSQGTTSFFVMASERPEYNDKIKLMQALSPIVFMKHLFSPIPQALAPHHVELEKLIHSLGIWELPAGTPDTGLMCAQGSPFYQFCRDFLQMLCGYDEEQMHPDQMAITLTNTPAGASFNNFLHYAQEIVSGHFRRWDYNSAEANQEVYGQDVPPDYDLTKVTAPVVLHYGQNDWFAAIVDVHRLVEVLPNIYEDHMIEYELFTHADFMWAKDVDTLLNNRIVDLFLKHSENAK